MCQATEKSYACDRCGHVTKQVTNHYGKTWSWGKVNTCPVCPPWAKYPEYGGSTTWSCLDREPTPEPTPVPCNGGCGGTVLSDNPDGLCFKCQCEWHASGVFDMDATDGIEDRPYEGDIDREPPDDDTFFWRLAREAFPQTVVVSDSDIPF